MNLWHVRYLTWHRVLFDSGQYSVHEGSVWPKLRTTAWATMWDTEISFFSSCCQRVTYVLMAVGTDKCGLDRVTFLLRALVTNVIPMFRVAKESKEKFLTKTTTSANCSPSGTKARDNDFIELDSPATETIASTWHKIILMIIITAATSTASGRTSTDDFLFELSICNFDNSDLFSWARSLRHRQM